VTRSLSGVSLGFNLLSISHLLDEGSDVLFRSCGGFWILEGTSFAWSFPRVKFSKQISLSVVVWLIAFWLVLRVSCGSDIVSWVT
jgi:hypothetical protein